jgi:transcriptional regulator with XRE-family HTH domain
MTAGQLFKTIRKEMGLSQIEMSEILGPSQSWLSKIEADMLLPDVGHLRTLAKTVQIRAHMHMIDEFIWGDFKN